MKIGLVVDDTLDKPDGVQQYVLTLGRWLHEQGHEVHYLAGETTRTDVPNIHSLARNIRVSFNGNKLSIPLPVPRKNIRTLFVTHHFDILHVMSPHSPLFAQRVVCMAPADTAVVGTFHILPHSRFVGLMTRLLGVWLRPSVRRMQTMLAVSRAAQEFSDQSFGTHSVVLPNVIDVATFNEARAFAEYGDRPTILFLGRIVERKGCIYLLHAIKYIVDHQLYQEPFRVLVCGKGDLLEMAKDYVRDHDLTQYVVFMGFVSEEDKPRYIASSDIAVYPSTGGESFGIVLLEAMAGTKGVVLAGDNPGYATVMEPHPEQLFDPYDIPAFAKLLVSYLVDSKSRGNAAMWQHEYVRQFNTHVVGEKLVKVYEEARTNLRP